VTVSSHIYANSLLIIITHCFAFYTSIYNNTLTEHCYSKETILCLYAYLLIQYHNEMQILGYEPHRGVPDSRPGQSMWDLWWTKWHWDRVFSEFFCFPLSISFQRRSPNSYHLGNEQYVCQWQQFRDVVSPHQNQSTINRLFLGFSYFTVASTQTFPILKYPPSFPAGKTQSD
jgi:hypothetical protein